MLGFSGITGTDARWGTKIKIRGLAGTEANSYKGAQYSVSPAGAPPVMPVDPGHEFEDVLEQLCGENAPYKGGRPYPKITNAGFVTSYAAPPSGQGGAANNFGDVMKCFESAR